VPPDETGSQVYHRSGEFRLLGSSLCFIGTLDTHSKVAHVKEECKDDAANDKR
jgi:hypothetical protein